jgi:hypothetical protein
MALFFFSKDTFNCQGKIMVFPFTKKKKKKNDLSSGLLWVMKVCGMTTENIFESKNNNTQ